MLFSDLIMGFDLSYRPLFLWTLIILSSFDLFMTALILIFYNGTKFFRDEISMGKRYETAFEEAKEKHLVPPKWFLVKFFKIRKWW